MRDVPFPLDRGDGELVQRWTTRWASVWFLEPGWCGRSRRPSSAYLELPAGNAANNSRGRGKLRYPRQHGAHGDPR